MGTSSLVAGIGLIMFGFYFIFREKEIGPTLSEELIQILSILVLIFGIAMIVGGGLLLRKFDKDRKKEKTQG